MKTWRILAAIFVGFASAVSAYALPPTIQASPFDAQGRIPQSKSYASPWRHVCANVGIMEAGATSAATATDFGETDRLLCKSIGPITRLKLGLPGRFILSGTELNAINTVFFKASVEYPDGQNSTPPCFSGPNAIYSTFPTGTTNYATGCPLIPVYPGESIKETFPLGVAIAANSTYRIRYGSFVAVPPSAAAVVGSASSGALAASTQYFYKVTCVRAGAESGPSAETSATTTGSVLNINVTLTYPNGPVGCDYEKLYRSTTTGTETFLAAIAVPPAMAAPTLVFADAGQTATQTGSPPVANRWPKTSFLRPGDSTTASSAAGNSGDVVSAAGTLNMITAGASPVQAFVSAPAYVQADDLGSFPVCLVSDSLGAGRGIIIGSAQNGLSQASGSYFAQAMPQGTYHSVNLGISGTTMGAYTSGFNYGGDTARLGMLDGCAYEVVTLSINDLVQGRTWIQVAQDTLSFTLGQAKLGKKIFVTTLGIDNTSNDNGILLANQTPVASESQRAAYNTWVRNGRQTRQFTATTGSIATTTLTVTGSNASLLAVGQLISIPGVVNNTYITALGTGTGGDGTYTVNNNQTISGAMTATVPVASGGTPASHIADYWDLSAAEGEVNSSGTPTLNGGFFPAAVLVGAGTFSGSPTTTTQPFTGGITGVGTIAAHSLIGYAVKITSGAASGQNCVIADNTTANMTCNAGPSVNLTVAPAAGDTFNVYNAYANDALHPTLFLNTSMASGSNALGVSNFAAFAAANFGGY